MSDFETVDYRLDESVAIITLNRPQARNSLTPELRAELYQAIRQANNDPQVRVVVIAGAGKGFCAGADLVTQYEDADEDGFITHQMRTEYHPILQAILESDKPYISAVNGAAAGFGGSIAMASDLLVMADNAFFYCAFGAIALIPDGGAHWQLNRYLGSKKAFEMIAESQRLSAQQCEEMGMANRVVAADTLLEETLAWAKSLATQAPLTLKYSKQILREVGNMSLTETLEREAQLQNITFRSDDYQEGLKAFFEKRAPKFLGK